MRDRWSLQPERASNQLPGSAYFKAKSINGVACIRPQSHRRVSSLVLGLQLVNCLTQQSPFKELFAVGRVLLPLTVAPRAFLDVRAFVSC